MILSMHGISCNLMFFPSCYYSCKNSALLGQAIASLTTATSSPVTFHVLTQCKQHYWVLNELLKSMTYSGRSVQKQVSYSYQGHDNIDDISSGENLGQ